MLKHLFLGGRRFSEAQPADDCETLLPDSKSEEGLLQSVTLQSSIPTLCMTLLWTLSLAVVGIVGVWIGSGHFVDVDRLCTQHTSQFSPVVEDIDITYNVVRYEGSLMHENIFRQLGSPEVDTAWESLGIEYRHVVVPESLAERSGLAPSQVQISEKYGGGYPANVEGLHHLHCLNLVRKALYYNFDYYNSLGEGEFSDDKRTLQFHVSHCLDIIRQQLMCTVDIAILGQVWWNKDMPIAFPDFNTEHICRNYDAVRKWAEEHQAPKDEPSDYLKPPQSRDDVLESMP